MEKRAFDFKSQINKLNNVFKGEISTVITATKVFDAVFSIAEKGKTLKYQVVSLESDYLKYGASVTSALKKAGVEFSVFLINANELDFAKPEEVFSVKNSQVIIIGGKDIISYVLFYVSKNNQGCHAVLTEPHAEGLLGKLVTVPDGGFVKVIDVEPLKTIILDKDIINKASGKSVAYAYIKSVGKAVALIDYKLALLVGSKKLDKIHYDRARLAVTLISKINEYENFNEVLAYASILIAEVLASSNVLTTGGQMDVAHALELVYPNGDKSNIAYVAIDRTIKLYHSFFVNDLSNLFSVADYNGDVSLLSKVSGKDASYFLNLLKIPTEKRRKLLNKLFALTKNDFIKETSALIKILPQIKSCYLLLKKEREGALNIKYAIIKNGITLAPYLSDAVSVLSTMRDFGVLALAK